MGQNAAIKEWRRGNTTLPVVFITLTRIPAILLVAANAFGKQEETTTSQRHVNQEHYVWTVANNYSNCHRKKTGGLRGTNSKVKLCVCS